MNHLLSYLPSRPIHLVNEVLGHFLHPAVLLLLVPLALLALWLGREGRTAAVAYSSTDVVRTVGTTRRTRLARLLPALQWLGATLLVVALARPRIERPLAKVQSSGVDVMLAIDVSGSMQAEDMADAQGTESRIDAAKEVVSRFVQDRPDDRIGVISFAGEPYLASPLTLDHDWVLQSVEHLDAASLTPGTAIGSAIASGVRRLDAQGAKSKILVVLTDGQNNAGKIQPSAAAEAARALGVKVYTIGVGSTGEALMPVTDEKGHRQLVAARVDVDEPAMQQVAETTGGKFYRATDTESLRNVYADIDRLEKTSRTRQGFVEHEERFSWFAIPGLCAVFASLALSATRFRRVP